MSYRWLDEGGNALAKQFGYPRLSADQITNALMAKISPQREAQAGRNALADFFFGGPAPMEPDLQQTQMGARPEAGQTRRPGALPLTRDAETGWLQLAMPKLADIAANGMPSVAGSAVAPVATRAGETVLGSGPIRAYHGSPHSFDRFSMDKIGTGEGAQAYGHGLYFAENEGVARSYREQLSKFKGWDAQKNGRTINFSDLSDGERKAIQMTDGGNVDDAIRAYSSPRDELDKDILKSLQEVKSGNLGGKRLTDGSMYEVNINAKPETFLDWDKPWDQQSPLVREIMGEPRDTVRNTGQTRYKEWAKDFNDINGEKTSQILREAGISGIRYLDGGSRGAGAGSSNYVVFDDKTIEILRKYGLAGLGLLPPAIGASVSPQESERSQ